MPQAMSKKQPPRVLVIGWDGADWRVLRPMLDAGLLPNLQGLLKEALVGDLISTLPPVTAPAWATFLTGLQPGRHGLITWRGPLDANLRRPLLNASHIHGARLWQWLGNVGLRACFLNVPLTYPPEPVDGVMVSGMLTPGTRAEFTYPADVRQHLLTAMPDYQLDVEMQYTEKDRHSPRGMRAHLAEVRRVTEQRTRAWQLLWANYGPFDFAMVVFGGTDRLQHPYYAYAVNTPPPGADPHWHERRQWVLGGYTHLDAQLGHILAMTGEKTTIIFLSDHGFGPLHWEFFVNEWLAHRGWLTYRESVDTLYRPLRRLIHPIKRFLPQRVVQRGRAEFSGLQALDWSRTLAYGGLASEDGVWINLQGREHEGIVPPDRYEEVRQEIMDALLTLRTPEGAPLFRAVYRREEVYRGPYVSKAADIILDPAEGVRVTPLRNPGGPFRDVRPMGEGTHRREGVLAVWGPGIQPGTLSSPPDLADLMPTILALLDIPVPVSVLDGRVIEQIVPSYAVSQDEGVTPPRNVRTYSSEEMALVEEHLRALGYVD